MFARTGCNRCHAGRRPYGAIRRHAGPHDVATHTRPPITIAYRLASSDHSSGSEDAELSARHLVALSANDLNYGGGIRLASASPPAPRRCTVFYGSQWGTQGTDANGNVTLYG